MQTQLLRADEAGAIGGQVFGSVDHMGLGQRTRMGVRFYMDTVTVTDGAGTERVEAREHVEFPLLGEQTKVRCVATDKHRRQYAQAYAAFSRGLEAVAHGTPLESLPGITNRQVQMAAIHGVRTIEDMTDERAALAMGMEGRTLSASCRAWLEQKAGAVEVERAAKLEAATSQIETLMRQMAEMQAAMQAKDAVIAAVGAARGAPAGPQQAEAGAQHVDRKDETWEKNVADAFTEGDDFASDDDLSDRSDLDTV